MPSYRDEARRALESSAARRSQNEYLNQIKDRHPALSDLADVEDLLAVLRDPGAEAATKDALLLALLKEHQRGAGGGAFALLAVAMFPALDHIYRARVYCRQEADDLWGRVVSAFAETLDRYPTDRRTARVAANIEGETLGNLRRAGLREAQIAKARDRFGESIAPHLVEITAHDPTAAPGERLALGDFATPGSEQPVPPGTEEFEEAETAVAPLFDATGIAPEDRFLILGVHLYERTLGELAAELGISREAAKKRHVRALTRLRRSGGPGDEGAQKS